MHSTTTAIKSAALSDAERQDILHRIAAETSYSLKRYFGYGQNQRIGADKEIVLAALAKDADIFAYASPALRDDKEVVLAAINSPGNTTDHPLRHASQRLKNDKEVALASAKAWSNSLAHMEPHFKADPDVMLMLVANPRFTWWDIRQADASLLANEDFMLKAIALTNWPVLKYAADSLHLNRDFIIKAVAQTPHCFEHAKNFQGNQEIALAAITAEGCGHLHNISSKLRADKEFIIAAIAKNPFMLQYASDSLRADPELVLMAASKEPETIEFSLVTKEAWQAILKFVQAKQTPTTTILAHEAVAHAPAPPEKTL